MTTTSILRNSFCATILILQLGFTAKAADTAPAEGLRKNVPTVVALTDAKIVISPNRTIDGGILVFRDGMIESVGADAKVPDDARVISMKGKVIYPGLIDAFSEVSVDDDGLKKGAKHWNPEVRPHLNVADQYSSDATLNEKLRSQGITVRLAAPKGGVMKGTSALVTTGDAPPGKSILRRIVAQHIRLTVSRGRSRDQFPNSPMGAVALARQTFYDANWYRDVWKAHHSDSSLPRPERNEALATLHKWVDANSPVIADTSNELFVLRADRFAREFGLRLIVRGSGNEYRRIDAVRKTGRAIIVPLNFPKPPNVATRESAMNVTLEQLMHWDLAPENPARLERAGVKIALTSHGLADKSTFLKAVRKAVSHGLSTNAALRSLTTTPAELYGASDQLGTIEPGKIANFVVTDGDLFDKKAKVLETWVDGKRFEVIEQPLVDLAGDWKIQVAGKNNPPLVLHLVSNDGKLTGTIRPVKGKEDEATKLGRVGLRGTRFSCTFDGEKLNHKGVTQLSAVIESKDDQTIWIGDLVWPDGKQESISGKRAETKPKKKGKKPVKEKADDEKKPVDGNAASFAVNYPLGSFGLTELPKQSTVLFTGATVWTCGKQKVLENASLLVGDGKILAVGQDIDAPDDAIRIDMKGRHISPGIIDCHSHMATDGGINESTQAVTAEVRIGDFVDSDDIAIYRQLAGGVTCANVLHGSANPIGGQNQVIKFRWGKLPEEIKFSRAPQGIKFALGENVKQSNWGDEYTKRYPQTRMGVDQIIRDEFQAAREYTKRWKDWNAHHRGLPPRKDLELDAVTEILGGERWIHCHSYRQDEILALIRSLDDFGVTIGSFQHILEGYKVADAMAKHGATGSAFSDWWAYKFEVYDAIPYNGALMHFAGVNVSFNSDDRELARHLNHEAAKAVKYGGVEPAEALKFVTLNPAIQLRIDQHVGSIEVGKDADLAIWSGSPLSILSRCEQTWVDGRKYFDRDSDKKLRESNREMRIALIQKVLSSGETMRKPGEGDDDPAKLWPREDLFCHHHDHDHDHGHEEK